MQESLINLAYLVAAVLFILGIKGLTHPRTAVRGNMLAALGLLIAAVVTLLHKDIVDYKFIIAGLVIGGAIGSIIAVKIQMTAMPQLVALLNGFGGAASVLVAGSEYLRSYGEAGRMIPAEAVERAGEAMETGLGAAPDLQILVAIAASCIIGTVTFFGSIVAFAKLQGLLSDKYSHFPGQGFVNIVFGIAAIVFAGWMVSQPENTWLYLVITGICFVLGITLVIAIGGADMPVAIALLNSYSGLAASATGFVLNNTALIISGALVGASGLILTHIMCVAMNRSLMNVLVGGLSGAGAQSKTADEVYGGKVKSTSAEEIAMLLDDIQRFIVVPGYGMAVSQAQHAVRDLGQLLEDRGVEVEYAIHPVAGRMPGHMNVLLAEAAVEYDKLKTMEEINPTLETADVIVVIGANDVVNPAARTNPDSPIAGMPIIDVDKARTVVVIKRSLSPGYAGIPNPLFAADNTLMFFSDGKKAIMDIVAAIKEG